MSLNIKDPEAHRLAAAISARHRGDDDPRGHRGPAGAAARLERQSALASVEELLAIAARAASHVKRPYPDHAELLYDEHGLPR